MQIQWYPGHMTKARRAMQEDLKLVDLVMELTDARAPLAGRNPDIDKLAAGKARMIFLNKADLADDQATLAWMDYFRKKGITPIRLDARKTNFKKAVVDGVKIACQEKIERDRRKGILNRPIRAMVVGIPNVGKSTFINSLAGKTAAKTGNKPGVTRGNQWIKIDKQLELLDTPGILWPKFEDELVGLKLALTGAIKDQLLPMDEVTIFGLNYFKTYYPERLEERFKGIDLEEEAPEIIMEMTRKLGFREDYDRFYNLFVKDVRDGKLGRYTLDIVGVDTDGDN